MAVVKALSKAPCDVTLVDRRNHHLFQPLLYEVATAALSPGQIAVALRHVFRDQENASIVLGEVTGVDLEQRRVLVGDENLPFDHLVLATGSTHHYFGNDGWEPHAPGLKSIEDALEIRSRFLVTFERADRTASAQERARLMTVVIVGGGPTGVELAGTMSEVARRVLQGEFRQLDTSSLRIVLVEGAQRLLPVLPPGLGSRTQRDLEELDVEVLLDTRVTDIDANGVGLDSGARIEAANVVWAAGVCGAPVEQGLTDFARKDRRLEVQPDLSLAGHPDVFAIGDLAHVESGGKQVPGLAPAALQMGRYVGRMLARELKGRPRADRSPFVYRDKGTLATIGRGRAVAHIGRAEFGGVVAWLLWAFVHIWFLVGFRSRIMVLLDWAFAYATFDRGARLITGDPFSGEVPGGRSDRA